MTETAEKTILQCRRAFRYPVDKVFEAFIRPEYLKEWFGPKDFTVNEVQARPEIGGEYAVELLSPQGMVLNVKGMYKEIEPPKKLAFTFGYDPDKLGLGKSEVFINFNYRDGETEVELTQIVYRAINPEGRTQGWEQSFDKLEILLGNIAHH